MSRAAKAACHPVLTPQLQDTLRKTMLSGHGYGKRRSKAQHDTLEGALHQCPREVWNTTFRAWHAFSGEQGQVDPKAVAHTLLGDRQEVTSTHRISSPHEEVFRLLHASVLHACVENWQR